MTITPAATLRFRAAVGARLGLSFDDWQLGFLEGVFRARLEARRLDPDMYLHALESNADADEPRAIARMVTVPETHFFRNIDQFRALRETVLPDRLRVRESIKIVRVLSAGCATGEEPYTLAMILSEVLPSGWNLDLRACDVNPEVLARAARARFSPWAFRETPESARRRFFTAKGSEFELDPSIRDLVHFSCQNLADETSEIWGHDSWDVVFCRNVTMYFTRDVARAVMRRFEKALAPGGYLFLGHAESLRGLSDDFELWHTHGTFYYQRRLGASPRSESYPPPPSAWVESSGAVLPLDDGDWVARIRDSTERVRAMTEPEIRTGAPDEVLPKWDFDSLVELVREEHFEEALERLRGVPAESVDDPDVLILHASLLAHRGDFEGAEGVCKRLLELDPWNAGAHFVLALCDEGRGDLGAAIEHHHTASRFDPGFAMPRMHLGLLARRAGDLKGARRELNHALALFESEHARRILLFGGGFGRDALIALCRSELRVAGGEV